MGNQVSEKSANWQVNLIGVFIMISGFWELFLSFFQYEGLDIPIFFGIDIVSAYHIYAFILGIVSIMIGIGIFYRVKHFRTTAIILTWWNLLTSPSIIFIIERYIEFSKGKKLYYTQEDVVYNCSIIIVTVLVRIYVIYILRIKKAGYIFSKSVDSLHN